MKEKRKTRLNKTQGAKTEFLGFGAFADPAANDDSSQQQSQQQGPSLRWSPIYTGKEESLALLFPKLLKKDNITRTKSLQELQAYFQSDAVTKKQQVDALAHFFFLYHTKLTYDQSSTVRAEALVVLALAAARLPKAFSTLAQQNNRQVLGMMYCCHGDSAAEVRAVAAKYINVEEENSAAAYTLTDMQAGVWDYVEQILSYGRASTMQADLFATSLKGSSKANTANNNAGGGKGKNNNNSNDSTATNNSGELSEAQKDQLEEIFERVVGTALGGLQVWIQQHGIVNNNNDGNDNTDELVERLTTKASPVLWKTLSSPKPSLRNRTYSLLNTCCQKAPAVIFDPPGGNGFSQTLPQALASEKEPGNIPSLLEALLSYLAAYSKHHTGASPWDSDDLKVSTVTKHLIKLFKKSCYGASANQWGPTVLPLLAMLPSLEDQVEVLTAVWKGRELAIRMGDQMTVVQTVSESASFFLLRKGQPNNDNETPKPAEEDDYAKQLAELWLECLQNFLDAELPNNNNNKPNSKNSKSSSSAGPARRAQVQLGKALAGELRQFDKACDDRPSCAIHAVSDWFWQEKLQACILETNGYGALATIVQEMAHVPPLPAAAAAESKSSSRLSPILQEKFHKALGEFQTRSGDVPTMDAYDLMTAILQVWGIESKAGQGESSDSISMEKFVMNDVLRWMVIHTSSLSTQKQNEALAQKDFRLFGICAARFPLLEVRAQHWEAVLREVIAAKCRLRLLLAGLIALVQSGIPVEQIQCDLLDNFAIQLVDEAMTTKREQIVGSDNESHDEEPDTDGDIRTFLQTCAGLRGYPSLLRQPVLALWVDKACPKIVNANDPKIMVGIVPGAILETLLLLSSAPATLSSEEIHRILLQSWRQGGREWDELSRTLLLKEPSYFLQVVSESSKALREMLADNSEKEDALDANKKVEVWSDMARRLIQINASSTSSNDANGTRASLELVALGDLSLWESLTNHDFLFCCLMRIFHEISDPAERLKMLQSCGGEDGALFIASLLLTLSEASADGAGASRASQRKDRCAQLLAVLGGRNFLSKKTCESLLKATISRIEQNIREKDLDGVRRGVALTSQLCDLMIDRVKPSDVFSPNEDDGEDVSEEFERERLSRIIAPAITKEAFGSLPWDSCAAELVNIIFSQCGVGSERGIGSLHYDMFQLVLSAVGRLRSHLSNPGDANENEVVQELMLLSLSCGYGLNTSEAAADLRVQTISFDADNITSSVLEYHESQNHGESVGDLDRAVLSWLITSIHALKDGDLKNRSLERLYKGAISLLSASDCDDKDTLLALRSVNKALTESQNHDGSAVANLCVQAVMRVMECFSEKWGHNSEDSGGVMARDFDENCNTTHTHPAWRSLSHFPEILSSMVTRNQELLIATCSELVDCFVKALFVKEKRWFALRLLEAIARSTQVLGDATPDEATAHRLAEWKEHLDAEQKDELEEDVEITCELLPHKLMTEMESWSDEEYTDSVDDDIIIGRMLAWLCSLSFVDAFVRKDPAYRPSVCSYIDKSGSAEAILNQTLLHTGVGTERSGHPEVDMDSLLRTEETVEKTQLASLVLFRTVEALPTLSRKWWETDCPNVYADPIKIYIEDHIAPKILRSELERLKNATINNAFGAMTVTGSVTTREITASYIQDEIKLRVMIRLPPFFPLRNAEVDCSQTLGVSAKRWKLWSLQITLMLNNQGGTLQEALMLWKENVDKEFMGVEPCPVCYSVLHIKSHKLPELECTTCSNRFHTQCITEWFRKSGKTQCVICQQQWNGTRVKK